MYIMGTPENLDAGALGKYAELHEEAKKLGEDLCSLDKTSSLNRTTPRLQKFDPWIDELYVTMSDIVDKV